MYSKKSKLKKKKKSKKKILNKLTDKSNLLEKIHILNNEEIDEVLDKETIKNEIFYNNKKIGIFFGNIYKLDIFLKENSFYEDFENIIQKHRNSRIFGMKELYEDSSKSNDNMYFLIIYGEKNIISMCRLKPKRNQISLVITSEKFRRKGYSLYTFRVLFKLIKKIFPEIKKLNLEVNETNIAAINLYKKLGFSIEQYIMTLNIK
jgi:RimJ/RimL family protein N-acetyltransferase